MNTFRNLIRSICHSIKRCFDMRGYKDFVNKSRLNIKNTQETIDYILKSHVSVSRFGDGEYRVMNHSGNGFQNPDDRLGERLKEVLDSHISNHIVCLPYAFVTVKHMTADAKSFWYPFLGMHRQFIIAITNPNKVYYDTNFTRFYMDMKNKKTVGEVITRLKTIWDNKKLLIVEGQYSRLGIGNDLFDNAKSIRRIICPSNDAFQSYEEILQTTKKTASADCLILLALGMTATVLAYDLAKAGYWAIDIGHVDVEYSWFKMGAKKKCPVNGKAVNEVCYMPEDNIKDDGYNESIIAIIK